MNIVENVTRDLRYALRTLLRTPGFTLAAVFALALGIGGSAAVFSVLDAVVLRPLPFKDAERLAALIQISPREASRIPYAAGDFLYVEKNQRAFESVAAYGDQAQAMMTDEGPLSVNAGLVTSSFFSLLKSPVQLGRDFTPADDSAAAPPVAILSDELWNRRFGGSRKVIGSTVALDGRLFTIIGVASRGFAFPALRAPEIFTTLQFEPKDVDQHAAHGIEVLGRLKPGVSVELATADVDRLAAELAGKAPQFKTGYHQRVEDLRANLTGPVRPALFLLLAATLLVLLIGCFNVASMLLARGAARHRELAIRAALGAGRGAIVRQLLVESLVLGLFGGAAGALLAAWGVDALVATAPADLPRLHEIHLDARVLLFALCTSIASGMLAGLAPALHTLYTDLHPALKAGSQQAGGGRGRLRGALVIAEVCLAVVLVLGAGLLLKSFQRVLDEALGFEPRGVFTARFGLPQPKYDDARIRTAARDIAERISRLPGVEAAALTSLLPTEVHWRTIIRIEGQPEALPGQGTAVFPNIVEGDIFAALRIPVRAGRAIGPQDAEKAPLAVMVNEAFVRKYLKNEDPVGKRMRMSGPDAPWRTIVGVAGDVRAARRDQEVFPQIYLPMAQFQWPDLAIVARTKTGRPLEITKAVAAELAAVDRELPLIKVRTLEDVLSGALGQRRFQMTLVALFAAIALSLAAVGIYGVMAYSVAQRTREMGVRMALGAPRARVLRMVVFQGLRLAAFGIGCGLFASLLASRGIASALYGISPNDPATYALVATLLAGVAALASFLPARRATRVDPAVALRAE